MERTSEVRLDMNEGMNLSRRPISGIGTHKQQPEKASFPANLPPESRDGSPHHLGWGTRIGGVFQGRMQPDGVRCAPKPIIALPQGREEECGRKGDERGCAEIDQ